MHKIQNLQRWICDTVGHNWAGHEVGDGFGHGVDHEGGHGVSHDSIMCPSALAPEPGKTPGSQPRPMGLWEPTTFFMLYFSWKFVRLCHFLLRDVKIQLLCPFWTSILNWAFFVYLHWEPKPHLIGAWQSPPGIECLKVISCFPKVLNWFPRFKHTRWLKEQQGRLKITTTIFRAWAMQRWSVENSGVAAFQ